MFNILIIDEDASSNRKIEEILKNKTNYVLTAVPSVEKATELIAPNFNKEKAPASTDGPPALKPQLIFVDITKIKGEVAQWYIEFYEILKAGSNENTPIILLSLSSDPLFIRGFLGAGVHDVFVKPVITTSLETTLNYFINNNNLPIRKMTPMKASVEMYFPALAQEISEFEMKLITTQQISLNDFKPIYGDFFKWSPERRVIARCTQCQEDEETEGYYIETFTFVGVPPAITKEIRIWLKSQYVAQKQSAKQK